MNSNTYITFWKRMFDYQGVASRSQYWIPWLINLIITTILGVIARTVLNSISTYEGLNGAAFLGFLLIFITLIISIATFICAIRRLHDSNKSGFLVLLNLIPIIGGIIVLIFLLLPTQKEYNRWRDYDIQRGYIKEAE